MPSSIAFYYEPSSFATRARRVVRRRRTLIRSLTVQYGTAAADRVAPSVLNLGLSTMPNRGVEEMRREIMLNRATAYLSHVSEKNRCLAPIHDAGLVLPYSLFYGQVCER
jgi:hypothetical protein